MVGYILCKFGAIRILPEIYTMKRVYWSLSLSLFFLTGFAQFDDFSNNKIPDTLYYSIYCNRTLIEIDRESAWQRDVDWHEGTQPRAMEWSQLIPLPDRNVILIRNKEYIITQVFNSNQPLSYWNSIFQHNKTTAASDNKKMIFSDPYSAFRYSRQTRYPYLGNHRVRTHLNNGCYLVNQVNPDAPNSINRLDGKHLGVIDSAGLFVLPIIYDYIELIGDEYLVKKDGWVGIVNNQSDIILPLIYEAAAVKQDGSVVFSKNGKVKKVYHGGKKKLSTLNDYDWIDENRLDDNINPSPSDLIMVVKNGKYGFVNRNFEVVVAPIYDYISYARPDELIRVCDGKKWGFMNKKGTIVIPIEYDDAIEFYEGKALVMKGDSSICLDKNGLPTTGCITRYAQWEVKEGGSYTQYIKGRRIVSRSQLKGVVDDSGKLVIPIIYSHIRGMESNTSEYRWSKLYYIAAIGNRWGVLDKDGKVMIPFIYDDVVGCKGGMEYYTVNQNNRYGLLDNQFQTVLPCTYEGIDYVTCKGHYWFLEKGKWGLMNQEQQVIVEPQYDGHSWMKNGKIQVQKNKKFGMIDSTGKIVIPVNYESLGDQFHHGLLVACQQKKWGYLDSLHQRVIPFEYDDIRNFYKSITGVKKGKKYYFINLKNERVSDQLYDFIDHDWNYNGMIKVMNNGKVGLVNDQGTTMVPCEYDDLMGYSPDKGCLFIKGKEKVWIKVGK